MKKSARRKSGARLFRERPAKAHEGPATKAEMGQFALWMKQNPTDAEMRMSRKLEAWRVEFKFQKRLGYYIADFFIPERLLVIEVDGGVHDGRSRYDARRDAWMGAFGITVIRVPNEDVGAFSLDRIESVRKQPKWRLTALYNRVAQRRRDELKRSGWMPGQGERRRIRRYFGLDPQAVLTREQVLRFRSEVGCRVPDPKPVQNVKRLAPPWARRQPQLSTGVPFGHPPTVGG